MFWHPENAEEHPVPDSGIFFAKVMLYLYWLLRTLWGWERFGTALAKNIWQRGATHRAFQRWPSHQVCYSLVTWWILGFYPLPWPWVKCGPFFFWGATSTNLSRTSFHIFPMNLGMRQCEFDPRYPHPLKVPKTPLRQWGSQGLFLPRRSRPEFFPLIPGPVSQGPCRASFLWSRIAATTSWCSWTPANSEMITPSDLVFQRGT